MGILDIFRKKKSTDAVSTKKVLLFRTYHGVKVRVKDAEKQKLWLMLSKQNKPHSPVFIKEIEQ